ncbi:MAG: hypothetical protein PUC88_03535 [Clostridia bacterium]|nr:hypothetical protein [Clostridia bacterium]
MSRIKKDSAIMLAGGLLYGGLELLWRRRTHWSMIITGGLCVLLLYRTFDKFKGLTLLIKCIIGSAIITSIEFAVGCIVNLWLKLDVWDYSRLHFNLLGQICPLYSLFWALLSIPVVLLCKNKSNLKSYIEKILPKSIDNTPN